MNKRLVRMLWFSITILIGLVCGLYLGWVARPLPYDNTDLNSLREDYSTDAILMVAEIFKTEGNIEQAQERLTLLGLNEDTYSHAVQMAIITGGKLGYPNTDLELLGKLDLALNTPPTLVPSAAPTATRTLVPTSTPMPATVTVPAP